MATMVSEHACPTRMVHEVASSFSSKWHSSVGKKKPHVQLFQCSVRIRACSSSMANNKDIYNQVGLFQNAIFFFLCIRICSDCFWLMLMLFLVCDKVPLVVQSMWMWLLLLFMFVIALLLVGVKWDGGKSMSEV